ncbi:MAG TPA: hypothetical protein VEK11_16895 [Thermoanaerobaculia bacterium]|nr:hypothetical protein [Thermoanaerobaculia bacterium]
MRRALPLIIALAAFATLGILWIVTDRRASQRVYDAYSTENTSKEGLSLAYGYLAKRRKVGQLTRPLGRQTVEPNAVVFRVAHEFETFFDPEDLDANQVGPPAPKKRAMLNPREDAFVRGGGRFVIAARLGALTAVPVSADVAPKVFPIWPSVKDIELRNGGAVAFTELRPRMLPLFTLGKYVLLARERIGNGELYVLSAPELLQNDQLVDHLGLLAALAGEKRPVYFDEVLHGIVSDDGAFALAKEWNLGMFLLLTGVTALLVFWREGRRIGPAEEDYRETRSDAVDLVRSLGALYQEVTNDSEAIVLYHDALMRTVAHNTGLRGEALHKRVAELTGGLVPPRGEGKMPRAVFQKQLDTLNDAFRRIA